TLQYYPPITPEMITSVKRFLEVAGFDLPAELSDPDFLGLLPPGPQDAQPGRGSVTPASAHRPSSRRTGEEPRKASFGWLHLTDLHFGMSGQKWLWPNIREEFFRDLEKLHSKSGPWDLVLFTGDFVQKVGRDEFQKLNDLLGQLWVHLQKLGSTPCL